MADIKQSALELIGNTPILQLNRYSEKAGIKDVTLLAKLEYLNPAGSVKDRIALAMIEDAEKKGKLKPGDVHRKGFRQRSQIFGENRNADRERAAASPDRKAPVQRLNRFRYSASAQSSVLASRSIRMHRSESASVSPCGTSRKKRVQTSFPTTQRNVTE